MPDKQLIVLFASTDALLAPFFTYSSINVVVQKLRLLSAEREQQANTTNEVSISTTWLKAHVSRQ